MSAILNPLSAYKKPGKPLLISGPCSAETEQQVIATAMALKAIGQVDVFRAGIWKPRTRPGSFEGVGTRGLPWLQKAKQLSGLPVAIEVATARQVEDALRFDVDVLWIGARTTANPFSVQEIANALSGVDIPVLIKNPTNPDIELWIGAMERLSNVGLKKLGLIHRGFSSCNNTGYRNAPMWHLAIEMKQRNPELIMLNDPSHICGCTDKLYDVMETAMGLNFDGFIIESHTSPQQAWSDAAQQVTPQILDRLLKKIMSGTALENGMPYSAKPMLTQQLIRLEYQLRHLENSKKELLAEINSLK